MTTEEIKMALVRRALELGVIVTGLHSVHVEDGTVFALYDTIGPDGQDLMHYEFPFPELITVEELGRFSRWLAATSFSATLH